MVCGDPPGVLTHRVAGQTSRKPGAFGSRPIAESSARVESKKFEETVSRVHQYHSHRATSLMMKKLSGCLVRVLIAVLVCPAPVWCAESSAPAPATLASFADPNLEAAVRKFVIEKRDTDKPLTEADLVNLSTIQGLGLGITNLAGLEHCQNLASLDLSRK